MEELYKALKGDYNDAISRLGTDKLIERFAFKFLQDKSYEELKAAIESNDIQASFKAAHTLKGVAGNLAFADLYAKASNLTEQLRPCTEAANVELVKAVDESYELVVQTLKEYQSHTA